MKKTNKPSLSMDLIYVGLGIMVMSVAGIAMVGASTGNIEFAGAQSGPTSPGGGAIEIPQPIETPTNDQTEEPEEREEEVEEIDDTPEQTNTATDVPTPDSPDIEIEEIDESGQSEAMPVDQEFNLDNSIDTSNPIAIDSETGEVDGGSSEPTTVRTGGVAVWVTVAVLLLAGGGIWYYQKYGNRKSNFKMTEKK